MKNKLWKIYFWIVLINGAIAYIWYQFSRLWEIIDLPIFVISMVGLYVYIWKKEVFSKNFWKVFFPIQIAWNIFYFYLNSLPEKVQSAYDLSPFIISTITIIFYIPLFLALYRLAYNNKFKK